MSAQTMTVLDLPLESGFDDIPPSRRADVRSAKLLRGVELDSVWHVLDSCHARELSAHEVLIRAGEAGTYLYLVLSGSLAVHLPNSDDPVALLGAGDSVGELSLLDGEPRSATVTAVEPTRVLAIGIDEFWALLTASHELTLNVIHLLSERLRGNNAAVSESRRLQAQYQKHASLDALTGLSNRRGLEEVGPRLIRRFQHQGAPCSLLMIDVDHFKRFNDEHGHPAGDFVLTTVARVLRTSLRPTDFIARYGGEEFTVILPETARDGAAFAADRVRKAIEWTKLTLPDARTLPSVTASFGVAEVGPTGDLRGAIEAADRALYEAKRAGRNRVVKAPPLPVCAKSDP